MTRGQEKQIADMSIGNSKQDNANAQSSFAGAQSGLADFNNRLSSYYSKDPYQAGGEFSRDQSNINAARANATSAALRDQLERHGRASGENTTGYASTLSRATQQATLDQAEAQSKADAERLGSETKYQQYGIDASKFPVAANTQLYSGSLSGRDSSLSTGEQAAKAPGFWDWFMQNAQQGAKTGAEIAAAA